MLFFINEYLIYYDFCCAFYLVGILPWQLIKGSQMNVIFLWCWSPNDYYICLAFELLYIFIDFGHSVY